MRYLALQDEEKDEYDNKYEILSECSVDELAYLRAQYFVKDG